MLVIEHEKGQMQPQRVVLKRDWTPHRIGWAHRLATHTVTKAEEFVQTLLVPRVRLTAAEPRPVEILPNVDRLVEFFQRR